MSEQKKYRCAGNVRHKGKMYKPGDPIEGLNAVEINNLLKLGAIEVVASKKNTETKPVTEPDDPPAETQTEPVTEPGDPPAETQTEPADPPAETEPVKAPPAQKSAVNKSKNRNKKK